MDDTHPSSVDADAPLLDDEAAPDTFAVPQRRVWPVVVVLATIVGVVGFFVWRAMTAPLPLRVLVAVEVDGHWWEGSRGAAKTADTLGKLLADNGFQPVKAGDPEVEAVLMDNQDPLEAARQLKAAFVIVGSAAPEVIELPGAEGQTEVRVDATIEVRHVEQDQPVGTVDVRTYASDGDRAGAMALTGRSIGRLIAHDALPLLVGHESVQEILHGSDPKLVDELAPAKGYVASRQLKLDEVASAYSKLEERMGKEEGITWHSPPQAADQLIAVTAQGVLVNASPATPFFSPQSHELLVSSELEALGIRAPGGAFSPSWQGPSSVTYPNASAAGFPVAIVEYLFRARALSVVKADGTVERLVVSGEARLSEPRINDAGSRVAYVATPCKGCPREIAVRTRGQEEPTWQLTGDQYARLGTFRWLDDDRLLVFAQLQGEDEVYGLWAVNVEDASREGLLEVTGPAQVHYPTVHPKKTHVAVARHDDRSIVIYEHASGETTRHEVGGVARALTYDPTGDRIAFELVAKGRVEIAVLDVASGKVTALTDNRRDDRFPHFAPDGSRVYFEARVPDPALPRRKVMRIGSVAAP